MNYPIGVGWGDMSASQPDTRYRFYTCELKRTHWDCKKGFLDQPLQPNSFCSTVIAIESWKPEFLDPLILSYKVRKGVVIRPESNLYTRKSWEEAPGQREVKSSE